VAATVLGSMLVSWFLSSTLGIAILVSLAAFGLVVGLIQVTGRRRSDKDPEDLEPAEDRYVNKGPPEKRVAYRRERNPVQVAIAAECLGTDTVYGVVLDRTTDGVSLSVTREIYAGSVLTIRPANVSPMAPSLQVQVRHCHQSGTEWVVGCQWVKSPPYAVLLMFG
jgi:hypothetical protein